MSTKRLNLEYRLERLEFQNGAELGFRRARMLYNPADAVILIEQLDASPQEIDAALAEIAGGSDTLPEIKTIFYQMRVPGYPPVAKFYHPLRGGAGVRIRPRIKGATVLHFAQDNGRAMFSKEWTLADVTEGKIPLNFSVWQFHGWRHEH